MTVKLSLFKPAPVNAQAKLLGDHLPNGPAWTAGRLPSTNMGKLVEGLAIEFYRVYVLTEKLFNEMDITQADELLGEWERSVGLPDECFSTDVTLEQRRIQVEQKFANFGGVQKVEDFIRVAAVFGFNIEKVLIPTGSSVTFPLSFPIQYFDSTSVSEHTLVFKILGDFSVDPDLFPLPFPLPFLINVRGFLQCLFEQLAPANVNVIIRTEGTT